jgi:hypothetical protein
MEGEEQRLSSNYNNDTYPSYKNSTRSQILENLKVPFVISNAHICLSFPV